MSTAAATTSTLRKSPPLRSKNTHKHTHAHAQKHAHTYSSVHYQHSQRTLIATEDVNQTLNSRPNTGLSSTWLYLDHWTSTHHRQRTAHCQKGYLPKVHSYLSLTEMYCTRILSLQRPSWVWLSNYSASIKTRFLQCGTMRFQEKHVFFFFLKPRSNQGMQTNGNFKQKRLLLLLLLYASRRTAIRSKRGCTSWGSTRGWTPGHQHVMMASRQQLHHHYCWPLMMTSSPLSSVGLTMTTTALVLQLSGKGKTAPNIQHLLFVFIWCSVDGHISKDSLFFLYSFVLEVFPQQWAFEMKCIMTVVAPEKCSIVATTGILRICSPWGNLVLFCTHISPFSVRDTTVFLTKWIIKPQEASFDISSWFAYMWTFCSVIFPKPPSRQKPNVQRKCFIWTLLDLSRPPTATRCCMCQPHSKTLNAVSSFLYKHLHFAKHVAPGSVP